MRNPLLKTLCLALISLILSGLPDLVKAEGQASEAVIPDSVEVLDDLVVSATRVETPLKKIASSVTILHADDFANRAQSTVLEALRGVPGVDVVRTGSTGGNTAVFLRGANSEHTLVLIDGIEVNNPSSNSRFFNFSDLTLDNVERIEILRGPQSTLYGSDAMGGVINIITRKGTGAPQFEASSELGSYGYSKEQVSLRGAHDIFDYSMAVSRLDERGISAAEVRDGNKEKDGHEQNSVSTRLGIAPLETLTFGANIRYSDSNTDLDNFGGQGGDDPNRILENSQLFSGFNADAWFLEGMLHQQYRFGYTDQNLKDDNDPDLTHLLDLQRSEYDGRLLKHELQNDIIVSDLLTLVVGLETEQEKASSSLFSDSAFGPFANNFGQVAARSNGYYTQAQLSFTERFNASTGIRVDDHSRFGSEVTWRVAPTLYFNETSTKISSTVGTGFKAPSLYQLYSEYGREDLEPEKSLGVDAGVQQNFFNNDLTLQATYFWNRFDNLISFNSETFIFENISEAVTQGLEFSATHKLSEQITIGVDYTLLDTEDKSIQDELLRRAKNKFGGEFSYQFCDKGNINLRMVYTGPREDNDFSSFPPTRTSLAGYTLVNLAGSYEVLEKVEVFARIENLFDRNYQEVLGYGARGVGGFGGVRVSF